MTKKPDTEVDETNPEWTEEMVAQALSSKEFFAKKMGRPPKTHKKVPISLRIDEELLATIKATGKGWQTRVHKVLEAGFVE